jgi:hypothetical protein
MLKQLEVLWLNDNIIKSFEVHLIFLKCIYYRIINYGISLSHDDEYPPFLGGI